MNIHRHTFRNLLELVGGELPKHAQGVFEAIKIEITPCRPQSVVDGWFEFLKWRGARRQGTNGDTFVISYANLADMPDNATVNNTANTTTAVLAKIHLNIRFQQRPGGGTELVVVIAGSTCDLGIGCIHTFERPEDKVCICAYPASYITGEGVPYLLPEYNNSDTYRYALESNRKPEYEGFQAPEDEAYRRFQYNLLTLLLGQFCYWLMGEECLLQNTATPLIMPTALPMSMELTKPAKGALETNWAKWYLEANIQYYENEKRGYRPTRKEAAELSGYAEEGFNTCIDKEPKLHELRERLAKAKTRLRVERPRKPLRKITSENYLGKN